MPPVIFDINGLKCMTSTMFIDKKKSHISFAYYVFDSG